MITMIATHVLALRIVDVPLVVTTNDADVRTALGLYYAPYVTTDDVTPAATITLTHGPAEAAGPVTDVVREAGKKIKEAARDVDAGRIILKRATGVVMKLEHGHASAVGDLRASLNQAVNLINACYAKVWTTRGYALLHAAGVSRAGRTVVLAGVPGAGKSTAALHLVEAGFRFLSNDRVLARVNSDAVHVVGYPKQPRVNPGTLLHHRRLRALLEPDAVERLNALPTDALWTLEDKRDVDLDAIYGPGTVEVEGGMAALVLLTWSPGGAAFSTRRLTADAALSRTSIFAKDLGVFDLDAEPRRRAPLPAAYAPILEHVPIFEVSGRTDFAALVGFVKRLV
ncbi:MAG: HprK-related kinase B [Candidatus Rokuibacteriota bacterium]|nr:MAG: HprK-related kinase B [Candidatus Rokubacteria bacterium]